MTCSTISPATTPSPRKSRSIACSRPPRGWPTSRRAEGPGRSSARARAPFPFGAQSLWAIPLAVVEISPDSSRAPWTMRSRSTAVGADPVEQEIAADDETHRRIAWGAVHRTAALPCRLRTRSAKTQRRRTVQRGRGYSPSYHGSMGFVPHSPNASKISAGAFAARGLFGPLVLWVKYVPAPKRAAPRRAVSCPADSGMLRRFPTCPQGIRHPIYGPRGD